MKHLIPDSFFCLLSLPPNLPIVSYLYISTGSPLPEGSPCVGLLQIGITREPAGNRKAGKKTFFRFIELGKW